MENRRIYLSSPHMGVLEKKFIEDAFESNWIAPLGPQVDAFENEVASMVGAEGAVALSSGTAAIHLALKYIGVDKGDIVFCSALTFAASCNPIIYEGGEPVFIDSEPETWNMSPKALEKAIHAAAKEGKLPKAIIVVNLYGQSADYDPIIEICKKYKIPIIEDAAESLGAEYKGKHSGTLGYLGIYSFNGNKIITTSGGGMLVSNDKNAISRARFWATQARDKAIHYQHSELGYNYRLSNVLAAIGRGQLRVLKDRIKKKKFIYETYKNELSTVDALRFMPVADYGQPNYWLTALTIENSSKVKPLDIIMKLEEHNIESRPVWKPMQLQPFYKRCKFFSHTDKVLSISEDLFCRGICLPSDTKLTDEELAKVTSLVIESFK